MEHALIGNIAMASIMVYVMVRIVDWHESIRDNTKCCQEERAQ